MTGPDALTTARSTRSGDFAVAIVQAGHRLRTNRLAQAPALDDPRLAPLRPWSGILACWTARRLHPVQVSSPNVTGSDHD